MIGLNCGGATTPATLRRMISEGFEVDPPVIKESMYKGHFHIKYDGQAKDISIPKLEDSGYGRRSNCRRCKMKISRQADLACGQWGVREEMVGKATFVEVCSQRGAGLIKGALEAGVIDTIVADASCIKGPQEKGGSDIEPCRRVAQEGFCATEQ